MKYDIILFEQYRQASHHVIDLILIARLLKKSGLNPAILNIYGDYDTDQCMGIPLINLDIRRVQPINPYRFPSIIRVIPFYLQQHKYMCSVIKEIRDKADVFYFGSYCDLLSTRLTSFDKPCIFWGLRSSRLVFNFKRFLRNPFTEIQTLRLRQSVFKNPNVNFFVSNKIIKQEHVKLGIPEERLIIREERVLEGGLDDTNYDLLSSKTSFLTIGWMRKDKRVERTIQAYKTIKTNNNSLVLVGKSSDEYENILMKYYNGDNNITRIRKRLGYDDFIGYIISSHFVCFADYSDQKSTITNGTMLEALINYRPIIAPNYNPYAFYVKTYGIGLLYDPENIESYANTLRKAETLGTEYFHDAIRQFLKTITFDKVSSDVSDNIRSIIHSR